MGEPRTVAQLESSNHGADSFHFKCRQTSTTCPHRNRPAIRRIKIKVPLCSSPLTGKQLTRKPSGESGVRVIPRWEFLRFLETFWRATSPGQSAEHTFISWSPTCLFVFFVTVFFYSPKLTLLQAEFFSSPTMHLYTSPFLLPGEPSHGAPTSILH